jgi:hypothetical protein
MRLTEAEHCTIADCTIRACGDYAGDGVRVAGEVTRVRANFVHGFRKLEVELEKR